MSIYSILVQSHSILRYIILIFIVIAIVKSLKGVLSKLIFQSSDLKLPLWALGSLHVQVLTGLALYVISPKVQLTAQTMKSDLLRFFTMEHSSMMLISVILITIGYVRAKSHSESGHKQILIYYTIALLIILLAIPWPFREALEAHWI